MTEDAAPQPRLAIDNLTKTFGTRRVVDGVSLHVAAGQVTCLLGPSGCGKSTTLRLIAGIERADRGEIRVDGALVSGPGVHLAPEVRRIGLMFQDFALFPHLTVAANVAFGLKGARDANRARAEQMLARVDMAPFADAYPDSLSGGEQQRVALARALAPRPHILLMDEPFSGLDNRLRDGIRDATLELLKEEKTAVLLVTHDPAEAMRMADEIALMRDGQIVQRDRPHRIYTAPVDKKALAFFSDVNQLQASVEGGEIRSVFGAFPAPDLPDGARVNVTFRPEHVRVDFDRNPRPVATAEDGTPARAEVVRARFMGRESLVEFRLLETGDVIKALMRGAFLPAAGANFLIRVPRAQAFLFPADA